MPGRWVTCPNPLTSYPFTPGIAVLSLGVPQVWQVQTTWENLIWLSVAETSLLGPYIHLFGAGTKLGPFREKDTLQASPQKQAGLPPINSSWIGFVRAVVGKVAWQRPNGPRNKNFPKLWPTHSRKPSSQREQPHRRLSPCGSPGHQESPKSAAALLRPSLQEILSPKPAPKALGGRAWGRGLAPPPPRSISLGSPGLGALPPPSAPCSGPAPAHSDPGSQPGYDFRRLCDLGQVTSPCKPPFPPPPREDLERSCPDHPRGGGYPPGGKTLCEPLRAAETQGSQD